MSSLPRSDVDVKAIMRAVRAKVAARTGALATEVEAREPARKRVESVVDRLSLSDRFRAGLRADPPRWNFRFSDGTIYHSSRGAPGRLLMGLRRLLRPVQKLFWNPGPMVDALARQSDANRYFDALLRDLAIEVARLGLEVHELAARNEELRRELGRATAAPAGPAAPADRG